MWFLNLIVCPLIFPWVNKIRKNKTPFLIWFVNTDEPTDTENNYGADKQRIEWGIYDIESRNLFTKFWWYLKWNIVRNSFFYFKLHVIIPKIGTLENIQYKINTTEKDGLKWCDYNDRGTIYTTYEIDGQKHFRYSHTKEVKLLWIWKRIQNVQFGASGTEDKNRYIYKVKHKKPNK
jgi:hypothetical protein